MKRRCLSDLNGIASPLIRESLSSCLESFRVDVGLGDVARVYSDVGVLRSCSDGILFGFAFECIVEVTVTLHVLPNGV